MAGSWRPSSQNKDAKLMGRILKVFKK